MKWRKQKPTLGVFFTKVSALWRNPLGRKKLIVFSVADQEGLNPDKMLSSDQKMS